MRPKDKLPRTENTMTSEPIQEIFFENLINGPSTRDSPRIDNNDDERLWDKVFERFLLPRDVKRLKEGLGEKDTQIQELSRVIREQRQEIDKLHAPSADRACFLAHIVHDIKSEARKKGQPMSQNQIALTVDRWLEKRQRELKDVCPEGWLKGIDIKRFPRLFSECIKHPTLGGKAKTLITRS